MRLVKELNIDEAVTCKSTDSVVDVAKKIKEKRARHVIVVDQKEFPVGIISTVDINNKVVAEQKDPKAVKAEEIMTSPILVKNVEDDVGEVYRTMMEQNIYSVPVVEEGKLKGTVTFNNILKFLTKGE